MGRASLAERKLAVHAMMRLDGDLEKAVTWFRMHCSGAVPKNTRRFLTYWHKRCAEGDVSLRGRPHTGRPHTLDVATLETCVARLSGLHDFEGGTRHFSDCAEVSA